MDWPHHSAARRVLIGPRGATRCSLIVRFYQRRQTVIDGSFKLPPPELVR